jgi:AcrR family transcriptional regulator
MRGFSGVHDLLSVICMTIAASGRRLVYTVNMRDTRERIATATRRLFDRDGIEAVSMRRVAREVGVTAPAIYRHYRGRSELLEEITQEGFGILMRRLEETLTEPGTPLERILRLFDGYLEFAVDHPRHFDFLFLDRRPNVRSMEELRQPGVSPTATLLRAEVEAAMKAGQIEPEDVNETCLTLWAQAHGLIALYRAGRFGDAPEALREVYRRSLERLVEGLAP